MTEADLIALQSALSGADHLAAEMEAKWGVGRLPLLVPAELRERFEVQRYNLNVAVNAYDVPAVRSLAGGMERGWRALDMAAEEAGHRPLSPEVWEAVTPDGEVIAIVRTNAEAAHVTREGRAMQVWTLEELGRVIAGLPSIAKAKTVWPGATVTVIRDKRSEWDQWQGDELPEALREDAA